MYLVNDRCLQVSVLRMGWVRIVWDLISSNECSKNSVGKNCLEAESHRLLGYKAAAPVLLC